MGFYPRIYHSNFIALTKKAMFLTFNHQQLDTYSVAKKLVIEIYKTTIALPNEERYALRSQIRRATVSVYLNISEGASRNSPKDEKRFYEISRGSLVELDAALEICVELGYFTKDQLQEVGSLMLRTFQMLSKLIIKKSKE
jgi:four helix bundle protein